MPIHISSPAPFANFSFIGVGSLNNLSQQQYLLRSSVFITAERNKIVEHPHPNKNHSTRAKKKLSKYTNIEQTPIFRRNISISIRIAPYSSFRLLYRAIFTRRRLAAARFQWCIRMLIVFYCWRTLHGKKVKFQFAT